MVVSKIEQKMGEWWEEVRVLLCAPPRACVTLSFLSPIDRSPSIIDGGDQSLTSAVFGGVQPTSLRHLSFIIVVHRMPARWRGRDARTWHFDDIHIPKVVVRFLPLLPSYSVLLQLHCW